MQAIRPWRHIERRKSRQIFVGNVPVGGDAPIAVQTMTNTPTEDAAATLDQIHRAADAGVDIVRVSCPTEDATAAMPQICRESPVPIVADIHFHYKRGIEAAEAGAACLRINPGNIGNQARVKEVVSAARNNGCSIRIGVNGGSLERHLLEKYGEPCPDAMVESALDHARILDDLDFHDYKISVKASDMFLTVAAYQQLAEATDAPLHLGITEAGGLRTGTVKSSIGMGNLLWMGIGDTIRVSLSADPVEEVKVGFDMLKSLGLRTRGVNIIACPSCARQGFDVIKTVETLEDRLAHIAEPISLSIIGCVVNGPGEAALTDLGFTGGGKESGKMFVSGKADHNVSNADMIEHIVELVEKKAEAMRDARETEATAAE
ncbi:flavodoxin-dependent (E)-4-hydroxy-3-methylbut-2-enyl-diphosphate synthase [Ponticaulis profundi]|uniref:4-hydroxy-3-methylbut-2-en-1-yl diphosphate synthase (flavodoxin) n=1 Tax=Ponticaulis profundi TaxID=2665222 RepID=A0ABW1SAE1_9PROT